MSETIRGAAARSATIGKLTMGRNWPVTTSSDDFIGGLGAGLLLGFAISAVLFAYMMWGG